MPVHGKGTICTEVLCSRGQAISFRHGPASLLSIGHYGLSRGKLVIEKVVHDPAQSDSKSLSWATKSEKLLCSRLDRTGAATEASEISLLVINCWDVYGERMPFLKSRR
jgi:hypothetical protein